LTIETRAKEIYKEYLNVICPYIVQIELLEGKFPVEILNEIRAVFTHLSKYYLSDDDSIKEKNISKAEGHIKRSILDCYKYICVALDDQYKRFEKKYERVDLSLIDNGEFLPKLLETRKNAIDLMMNARESDFSIDSDDEINCAESYTRYEKTFIAYSNVEKLINESYKKMENLRKKAIIKDFSAVGGWVIGIIGIIIGIVSFFF
jgi:hypothetical protein